MDTSEKLTKVKVNLSLDPILVQEVKKKGINISEFVGNLLKKEVDTPEDETIIRPKCEICKLDRATALHDYKHVLPLSKDRFICWNCTCSRQKEVLIFCNQLRTQERMQEQMSVLECVHV